VKTFSSTIKAQPQKLRFSVVHSAYIKSLTILGIGSGDNTLSARRLRGERVKPEFQQETSAIG
jgi:hypothetical protein